MRGELGNRDAQHEKLIENELFANVTDWQVFTFRFDLGSELDNNYRQPLIHNNLQTSLKPSNGYSLPMQPETVHPHNIHNSPRGVNSQQSQSVVMSPSVINAPNSFSPHQRYINSARHQRQNGATPSLPLLSHEQQAGNVELANPFISDGGNAIRKHFTFIIPFWTLFVFPQRFNLFDMKLCIYNL